MIIWNVHRETYGYIYRDIIATFREQRIFEDEKIWLIPISSAKPWGTFLCITKPEKSRETMKKMINKLHEIGYPTANFPYLSWEDWTNREWLKIDQYLDKKIYSPYIKEDSVVMRNCCRSEKIIWFHKTLMSDLPEWLIFDTIDKKIYINKKHITHEDLFTQSATIEIMDILCNNQCKQLTNNTRDVCERHCEAKVSNKLLPASSYSKNKNEMIGKILLPLQKLVKKTYEKSLNISCSGSITDFTISLEEKTIPIYFINKIT